MKTAAAELAANGYLVLEHVLSSSEIREISNCLGGLESGKERTRNLLTHEWCAILAKRIKQKDHVQALLPEEAVAVQCSYFPKDEGENWKVGLHRDFFIPVSKQIEAEGWSGWSVKEGVIFVRPPEEILKSMVAIRLHLEDNTLENGPLVVVPGSHQQVVDEPRVACCVPAGGALAMRPLMLHASSKVKRGTRRVLHMLFGPPQLPDRQEWANAV